MGNIGHFLTGRGLLLGHAGIGKSAVGAVCPERGLNLTLRNSDFGAKFFIGCMHLPPHLGLLRGEMFDTFLRLAQPCFGSIQPILQKITPC